MADDWNQETGDLESFEQRHSALILDFSFEGKERLRENTITAIEKRNSLHCNKRHTIACLIIL